MLALALVNWLAALAIVPLQGLANDALKLRVMSYYNQLRVNGAINEVQLPKVDWQKLPGTDLQKAHHYFLGRAPGFYMTIAWAASSLLALNGGVLFFAYRALRKTSGLTK